MSKKEKLHREYALYEKLFFIAIGTLLAIISWVVGYYDKTPVELLVLSSISIVADCFITGSLFVKLQKLLAEIEHE